MLVKKRMLINIGLLAALDIGLLAAGVLSVFAIRKTTADIAAKQAEIDDRYALRLYVRNSVTDLADTKKRIGDLDAEAVREGKELELITALESASAASGVEQKIDLQTVNQKDLSPWERTIPLKLILTGTYPQILKHLNAIERLPYYLSVSGITITGQEAGGSAGTATVDATVNATVYWQASQVPDFVHGADNTGRTPS